MKKTSKSIIAVVLMLVCIFSFAAMPISAATTRSVQTLYEYEYEPVDDFLRYSIRFNTNGSKFIGLVIDADVGRYVTQGFGSDYIDNTEEFQLFYYVMIKHDGTNTNWTYTSNSYTIEGIRSSGVFNYENVYTLYDYSDITLFNITLYLQTADSIYYVHTLRLTPSQILAQ